MKGAVRYFFLDEKGSEDTISFTFEDGPVGNYHILISGAQAPASVQAMEDTELLVISKVDFQALMNKYLRYYQFSTQMMGEAFMEALELEKILSIASSSERYRVFFELKPGIVQRIPIGYLASYLKMALGRRNSVRAGKL